MDTPSPPVDPVDPVVLDQAAHALWNQVKMAYAAPWNELAPDDSVRIYWTEVARSVLLAVQPGQAALSAAWQAGLAAGAQHERNQWHWQAGALSRAVHGLKTRPEPPEDPYRV